ncbi:MAG: 2-iminobutanoate/2-iminopropanoate deaminase [Myxococcota bacterium]|jgi:2-iminobutanoate/2-iminopropanoate deaminase
MKTVQTDQAPAAVGPYSQAIEANGLVFCSGQIPFDPATGAVVEGGVAAQTDRVMKNLSAVLIAAGASLSDVVKTTIFLTDMGDFSTVNEVYASHLGSHRPARATVEVSRLPKDVLVEISCIAAKSRES